MAHQNHGLLSALRVTVADVRLEERPPRTRTGRGLEVMLDSFRRCAEAGADVLSVESVGGKEVFDPAILEGDVASVVFAVGVLGCSDVRFLWRHIASIAGETGALAGGDSACAFGNTAMQLAHQGYIPRVLAGFVRAISSVRTLCAYEEGATGPGKDCAYENVVVKLIAGVPIAMEGKTAACAHSSPLGNIASALCDLWTNESVENLRLFGGHTPEVFTEMLIYDCRLMNTAHRLGCARQLRDVMVASDRDLDPQALFLDPRVCLGLARAFLAEPDDYHRTLSAGRYACQVMRQEHASGRLQLSPAEARWLDRISRQVEALPDDPQALWAQVAPLRGDLVLLPEYGLDW